MKTTTVEQDPEAATKLRDLIEDISVAMLVTVTVEGALRSRPMMTQEMRGEGELWFLTRDDAGIAEDLGEEPAVNVTYADVENHRYVSVSGQAALVHDRTKQQAFWSPRYERFFPEGKDDRHLALVQVRIESAEYWDAPAGRMTKLPAQSREDSPRDDGRSDDGDAPPGEHAKVDIRKAPASG